MNPSASGWINRYLNDYKSDLKTLSTLSFYQLYLKLRACGFIYGTNIIPVTQKHNEDFKLTQEELAKVNLLTALIITHKQNSNNAGNDESLHSIIDFYNSLKNSQNSIFSFNWKSKKTDLEVENILHERIQTNDSFIQKNFSNIVTNALLFLDVLAYKCYLDGKKSSFYAAKIEQILVDTVYFAVKRKKMQGKYDSIILRLLQSSIRYHQISEEKLNKIDQVDLLFLKSKTEKQYLIDIICMTLYTDNEIDEQEKIFALGLIAQLNFSQDELDKSLKFMYEFVESNKSDIYYFNISNPVKYFYDKTYRSVSVLIHRNKKRIIKELYESKELMQLLTYSTYRELSSVEKRKVKSQLLDIFKTIPSLTIFALPGGSLLLPIIIKLIPTILPSSFNENIKEDEKNIER